MSTDAGLDPGPDRTRRRRRARQVAGATRRIRWGAVAGTVVLLYVVAYCLALSRIADRDRFNRWGQAMGSLGGRLVICVVVLAVLFHTFDGLRRMLPEVAPGLVGHDRHLRAAALFATWALALPCFAAIIWPWVAETAR